MLDIIGGPCRIRTYDQLIKSQLLYQTELTAHVDYMYYKSRIFLGLTFVLFGFSMDFFPVRSCSAKYHIFRFMSTILFSDIGAATKVEMRFFPLLPELLSNSKFKKRVVFQL